MTDEEIKKYLTPQENMEFDYIIEKLNSNQEAEVHDYIARRRLDYEVKAKDAIIKFLEADLKYANDCNNLLKDDLQEMTIQLSNICTHYKLYVPGQAVLYTVCGSYSEIYNELQNTLTILDSIWTVAGNAYGHQLTEAMGKQIKALKEKYADPDNT